ncbi:MAG TPA: M28 family peptidase [Gemmatimonadaceae bacterium]|nr:M28 family peptidase [Gemmatimonadaceae bacterium]
MYLSRISINARPASISLCALYFAGCASSGTPVTSSQSPSVGTATASASFESIDADVNARIRAEATRNSKVLETAIMISDIHGPRLAGSSGYAKAAAWARSQLADWGLSNAALEPWGRRGKGWELERFSVEMIAPYYLRMNAIPKAWSPGTNGVVSGTPLLVSIRGDSDFVRYRGKLRGRIVMNGAISLPRGRFDPPATRLTQRTLDSLANITDPGEPRTYWEDADPFLEALARRRRIDEFFRQEGVTALLEPSRNPRAVLATSHVSYATDRTGAVPAFILAREHYDAVARLIERNRSPRLDLSMSARFTTTDSLGYNIVAEIPGTDPRLANEVVMAGGHFDTWQAASGATDNAAGSAVVMEALRILNAIGVKPRRTIRIALWDGEEQEDYFGSMGYVRRHLGDPTTMRLAPGHNKFSAYFNVDHGTGPIRGFYLQGNAAARPVLGAFLAPFRDLGASTLSIKNYGSTDHMPFSSVGLPAFNTIHDPIDYETVTHHTSLDFADYLIEDDMRQASIVIASLLYHTAMRDALMPRTPLPAPKRASP